MRRATAALAPASLLLLASVSSACQGRPRPEEGPRTEPPKRHGPAVAVLDFTGGVPEEDRPGLLGLSGRKKSFDEALRVIARLEDAASDDGAKSVVVKLGDASIGAARAQELGDALAALRKKRTVHCHADGLGNLPLMLTAKGCSRVWLSPAGAIDAVGLAAQVVYMRRLLADELHLSIDMLQVGQYKGAEEPMTRDGPSPEARSSLMGVLTDLRASWIETLAAARPGATADVVEDGPWPPERAKELGLVDQIGYFDEVLAAARAGSGAVREQTVFGAGAAEEDAELDDLVRALAGEGGATGPIALVRATGSITMTGGGGVLGGGGGIVERELGRTIQRLERDDDVKAVVVRIDSPGGSALASDLMWHRLMELRKKKPLVFSVGDMAASGGYYLASTGDYIFAEPMSIVGSIGVVGGKVGIGEALERVGVHAETFPASPRPGASARAAYESALVRWDDATKARVLATMTSVYELFLARVAEGRSTRGRTVTREKVAENAEGKIFSGRAGRARGLVDELGGLAAALARARELARLPASARVAVVTGKSGLLDALGPGGVEEHAGAAVAAAPLDLLARVAPDLAGAAAALSPLLEGERTVAALPFALRVR